MNDILKKLQDECENAYIWRVGQAKDSGLIDSTWEEITPILNKELGIDEVDWRGSCAFRKRYRVMQQAWDDVFSKQSMDNDYRDQIRELEKAKIKLRDERTDYQKSLREDARKESFIELVERTMEKHIEPFQYEPAARIDSDSDMIVCLSDLHAGIVCDNYWNQFDTNILKDRICTYIREIISIQKLHDCKVCHIVLGGDMISGLVHQNLRLQNNENVIEQLKIAIEYIAEFINTIQPYFEQIDVYSVSGNHSRMSPNKEEHLTGEELDEMIPFCLKIKFENIDSVNICDKSMVDSTIGCFATRGEKVFYFVHGDKDTPSNVVQKLTLMVGAKPDAIIMGHRHHISLDSEHGVKIIQNGSVVGTDTYCVDHRISGKADQCVIITDNERAVRCLYDICLN